MNEQTDKDKIVSLMKAGISYFDLFLIAGVTVSSILYSVVSGTVDFAGSAAAVAGVTCVVLVSRGSIWNYLFGLVNVSLYAIISMKSGLYGDAALNALYYLPMQVIGYIQWKKRGADISGESVRPRRLSLKSKIALTLISVSGVVAGAFVLGWAGDPQPWKDSVTTVLSIIAQVLMAMAFAEQWLLWIIVNVVSIVMWSVFLFRGEPHAGLMVIMWVFYLANSVGGFVRWMRMSGSREKAL